MPREQESRTVIFTNENARKFPNKALIFDVIDSVDHSYTSTVAKHPIEGTGSNVADHQFRQNTVITLSGYVSDAMTRQALTEHIEKPQAVRDLDAFYDQITTDRAQIETASDTLLGDSTIGTLVSEDLFSQVFNGSLPAEYTGVEINAGDVITAQMEQDIITYGQTLETYLPQYDSEIFQREEVILGVRKLRKSKDLRTVFGADRDNCTKQHDGREFFEAIQTHRIICSVQTMHRLYENMVLTSLSMPRSAGQGCALVISATFEQQRFVEAIRSGTVYHKAQVPDSRDDGKNQGTTFEFFKKLGQDIVNEFLAPNKVRTDQLK
jgi:hypothetical protein